MAFVMDLTRELKLTKRRSHHQIKELFVCATLSLWPFVISNNTREVAIGAVLPIVVESGESVCERGRIAEQPSQKRQREGCAREVKTSISAGCVPVH